MTGLIEYTPAQIQLIKRTVAADTNDNEFDLFFEACKSYGLDPFRKQIHAVVYSKDNASKRKMTIMVSRDGLRVIAARCGDYRPASEKAEFEYDEKLKGPLNPKGIVSVTVKLWKRDQSGEWFPVVGEAEWDEFAPIKDEWAWDQTAHKRLPTGKKELDSSGQWATMPKVMIAKCAESQALRAGWPEQFGGIYVEEEIERAKVDASATQQMAEYEEAMRIDRIGGSDIITMSFAGPKLENVPSGQVYDRAMEFLSDSSAEEVYRWRVSNEEPLRQFWARNPSDAHALKKEVEKRSADFTDAA